MAKDPVCQMNVDETKAIKAEHDGQTYYFCAQGCKDRFLNDPERYLKRNS
ncbi:MAG: YHS domain-containing protein [Firmicutes bacterium]|nr:YHS domain-containing protein [Bacillota bacterium]